MKLYRTIDDIAKDDLKWRQIALKISNDKELADEILHTFYMKIIRLIEKKELKEQLFEINTSYIITSLKNVFLNFKSLENKRISFDDNFNVADDESYDYLNDSINQCLSDDILKDASQLDWFDKKLFQIIVYEKKISMRKLSRQSGISYNTIQKSVAKTKLYLKNKQELKWVEEKK